MNMQQECFHDGRFHFFILPYPKYHQNTTPQEPTFPSDNTTTQTNEMNKLKKQVMQLQQQLQQQQQNPPRQIPQYYFNP